MHLPPKTRMCYKTFPHSHLAVLGQKLWCAHVEHRLWITSHFCRPPTVPYTLPQGLQHIVTAGTLPIGLLKTRFCQLNCSTFPHHNQMDQCGPVKTIDHTGYNGSASSYAKNSTASNYGLTVPGRLNMKTQILVESEYMAAFGKML